MNRFFIADTWLRMAWGAYGLACISLLIPAIGVGRVHIGLEDVVALLTLPVATHIALAASRSDTGARWLNWIWIAIVALGIGVGMLQGLYYMSEFVVPTEMFQYVKRYSFFWVAYAIGRCERPGRIKAVDYLALACFLALCVGLWQVLRLPFFGKLSALYIRSDWQLVSLVERFETSRVTGVVGMATAWGGFSVFCGVMSMFYIVSNQSKPFSWRKFVGIGMYGLAFVNTVYSGSRLGLMTFIMVTLVFVMRPILLSGLCGRVRFKFAGFIPIIILTMAFVGVGYLLVMERGDVFLSRFEDLGQRAKRLEGGRFEQVPLGLSKLNGAVEWLMGIGNKANRDLVFSWGIEVEPVHLLVNYGLVGVFLRYALVGFILRRCLAVFGKGNENCSALGFVAFTALFGYLVFSLGQFFFHALFGGMPVWLLAGFVFGIGYKTGHRTQRC